MSLFLACADDSFDVRSLPRHVEHAEHVHHDRTSPILATNHWSLSGSGPPLTRTCSSALYPNDRISCRKRRASITPSPNQSIARRKAQAREGDRDTHLRGWKRHPRSHWRGKGGQTNFGVVLALYSTPQCHSGGLCKNSRVRSPVDWEPRQQNGTGCWCP